MTSIFGIPNARVQQRDDGLPKETNLNGETPDAYVFAGAQVTDEEYPYEEPRP